MTAARFTEVFRAAITLEGRGSKIRWYARSPLVVGIGDAGYQGGEAVCSGDTPEEAVAALVAMAVQVSKERLQEARAALLSAEERWRRIEAAAVLAAVAEHTCDWSVKDGAALMRCSICYRLHPQQAGQ